MKEKGYIKQLTMILREIEKDPTIITAVARRSRSSSMFNRVFNRFANRDKWQALAVKLNAVKNGKQKTTQKWKQCWKDLGYRLKKKATRIDKDNLTLFERHILKVITDLEQATVDDGQDDKNTAPDDNSSCQKGEATETGFEDSYGFNKQLVMMARAIERDPLILTAAQRRLNKFDKLANGEQWQALSTKLNTVKYGKQKTGAQWKQCWRDMVYKLRRRAASPEAESLTKLNQYVLKVDTYRENFVRKLIKETTA